MYGWNNFPQKIDFYLNELIKLWIWDKEEIIVVNYQYAYKKFDIY